MFRIRHVPMQVTIVQQIAPGPTQEQVNAALANQPPIVDPYLLTLRKELRKTFFSDPLILATDAESLADNAGIMTMFTNVFVAFQIHASKAVVRNMIELVDVADVPSLAALKAKLLSLPEWTTDTSDVA